MSRATRPLQLRDANGAIIPFNPADFKMRIKYVGSFKRFYGKARPGADETAAVWRVEKEIINSSGNTLSVDYAGGILEYNNIWNTGAYLNISDITQASPAVVTVSSTSTLSDDNIIYIDSISGMTELNNTFFYITVLNATTFSLQHIDDDSDIDSSGYGAYVSGGKAYKPEYANYSFS